MTYKIAHAATREAVHDGDLGQLVNDILNTRNNDLKSGCVFALFECVTALKAAGIVCTWPEDERATAFMAKSSTRIQAEVLIHINAIDEVVWRLTALVSAINANAQRLNFPAPAPTAAPEPQLVRIVGMPDRASVQSVERDASDEITRTVTVEQDR